jgi:hypothetical protein
MEHAEGHKHTFPCYAVNFVLVTLLSVFASLKKAAATHGTTIGEDLRAVMAPDISARVLRALRAVLPKPHETLASDGGKLAPLADCGPPTHATSLAQRLRTARTHKDLETLLEERLGLHGVQPRATKRIAWVSTV